MPTQIKPSDSYTRFLAEPTRKSAPEHIKKLIPKYRITHFLGAGGFADVYEGTDENGWGVAVKVPQFKMEKTMDSTSLKRFASEADIWKKLQHENIVNVYGTEAKPIPHIVMELMDGGDLESLMRKHVLSVGEAVHIMAQILEGISYAHRMATVHRDLKPENILFTSDGVAKITDWGIGKYMASEGLTKTLDTKGTLAYSAPEQFDTKEYGEVDWQTDIFQLGIVFYEILTGVKPFAGEDMAEIMGKVLAYYPVPPSEYNSNVPSVLDDIVMGALEKEKEYRWESGTVMLHELKLVIKGEIRTKRKRKMKISQSMQDKRDEILGELDGYVALLYDAGVDVSELEREIESIERSIKLRWYEKAREQSTICTEKLKNRYYHEIKQSESSVTELLEPVRVLFESCHNRGIDVEDLYETYDDGMNAYENRQFKQARALLKKVGKELAELVKEDKRRISAWEEYEELKEISSTYGVLIPENIESMLQTDIVLVKKKLHTWRVYLEKVQEDMERQRIEKDEEERISKIERELQEEKEMRQRELQLRMPHIKKEVEDLDAKRKKLGIKNENIQRDLQSASTRLKNGALKQAEGKYSIIRRRLQKAIIEYEKEQEAEREAAALLRKQHRRQRNKKIAILSVIVVIVVVILVGSGIGGYIWYNWDSDGDGIRDEEDAFPNDPAASVDSDGDGYPDEWNEGTIQKDSTTGLELDRFPNNRDEWADSDNDTIGDNGDEFPYEPTQWSDIDRDGYGDNSSGKNPDKFPKDHAASLDSDCDGYPDEWNNNMTEENSTTNLTRLDDFPHDPAAAIDTDGDGWGDNYPNASWLDERQWPMGVQHIPNAYKPDRFPFDPKEWADGDNDGQGDNETDQYPNDTDNDGCNNSVDVFPNNPDEWEDNDSDGYGDNKADAFPKDNDEWADDDEDGYGDNIADKFPNNPTAWADSNGDGIADEYENTIEVINLNNVTFTFVSIPSGTFGMGSSTGDLDEDPPHTITITKGFQILKYEVTQAQWEVVMGSNPSHFDSDNKPVETVSWDDCQSFISRLNELDPDHIYRLPTEAEWEYACRAGSTTIYSYGDDSAQLGQYAWYDDNSNDKTHPVGEKKPNTWGMYDMHGNVLEWCQDWYDSDYYENSPGTDPQGPNSGSDRVIRGGCWINFAAFCRSACRSKNDPYDWSRNIGLRLLRTEK